jgi:hypothetical protein
MSDDDDDEGITSPARNADTLAPSVSSPAVPGLAKPPAAKRTRPVFEVLCRKPHRRVSKAGSSANSSSACRRALALYHADREPVYQDLYPASLLGRQTKLKTANATMKCKFCSEVRSFNPSTNFESYLLHGCAGFKASKYWNEPDTTKALQFGS